MAKKSITFKEIAIDPEHQVAFKKITDLIRLREVYACKEPISAKCFILENDASSCNCPNKETIQVNTKFGITDRSLGKTKNSAIWMLYMTTIDENYQAGSLGRDWSENTTQTRPYYEDLLQEWTQDIWQDEEVDCGNNRQAEWRDNWFLDWRSLYRGITYKGKERIKFLDLYNPAQVKRRVNKPLTDLIFDEFIPSRDMREQGKGYQINEVKRYSDIEKSCRRKNPNINRIFLGNPNEPYWNVPYLTSFLKEIEALEKWYWENRPNDAEKYRQWTWTKKILNSKKQVLVLEKMVGDEYEFDSYEEFNWDLFFAKREKLGVLEWEDGWQENYTFNNLACFVDLNNGVEVMVEQSWLEKNKPEYYKKCENTVEYVVDNYTFIKCGKPNYLKAVIDGEKFKDELKWKLTEGRLKFLDLESRMRIENFITSGKIGRENKDIFQ